MFSKLFINIMLFDFCVTVLGFLINRIKLQEVRYITINIKVLLLLY